MVAAIGGLSDRNMSDCWKCDHRLDGGENYCTQCGSPQKPRTAAGSFDRNASKFGSAIRDILELLDGCPEMLAEGMEDLHSDADISASEWERRFENSLSWLQSYFYTIVVSHYDIDVDELLEEYEGEIEDDDTDIDTLPSPQNETCACGASLPTSPPSIITRWKDTTETSAVCFECFGQIRNRIEVPE
jgi:hypothetical protein